MFMKIFTCFLVVMASLTWGVKAQLSFGGDPLYNKNLKAAYLDVPYVIMPAFVPENAHTETPLKRASLRFAHPFFVALTTKNSGKWFTMADGTRVWRLGIRSSGARSLNLIFDRFKLPEGSRLFVFDPDLAFVLGAYTNESNGGDGPFALSPVPGEVIILEYQSGDNTDEEPELVIGAVNHDYLGLFDGAGLKAGRFGDAGSCNINVSCAASIPLQEKGVCKIIVDGTELCSGILVNNTLNNGVPYFLTAAHCLHNNNANQAVVFFFNYQVPDCQKYIEGLKTQSLSGALLRAKMDSRDITLLELHQRPPASFRPYWSGWNLGSSVSGPVQCLHHPWGDVKKISVSNGSPTNASYNTPSFSNDSHWRVSRWDSGTTEPGSSGSGLFDTQGRLIGTLSGGAATCSNPVDDYFSRLNQSWTHLPAPESQLKAWLDPANSGALVLAGLDYYKSDLPVRVSNFTKGDSAVVKESTNPSFGYWMGHNNNKSDAVAEEFPTIKQALVHGVYLMMGKSVMGSEQIINLKLWSGGSIPGTVLASKNNVKISSVSQKSENYIAFDEPVMVSGPVFAGIEYSYSATPIDSIGLYWLYNKSGRLRNHAYLRTGGLWQPFNILHPSSVRSSVYIDLLASQVVLTDTGSVHPIFSGAKVYPNPANVDLNFEWSSSTLQTATLYLLNGKLIMKRAYHHAHGNDVIDIRNLAAGVYVLKLTFNDFTQTVKVVKR